MLTVKIDPVQGRPQSGGATLEGTSGLSLLPLMRLVGSQFQADAGRFMALASAPPKPATHAAGWYFSRSTTPMNGRFR